MSKPVRCPECGKVAEPEPRDVSETWNIRGEEVKVEGELNYCPACGFLYTLMKPTTGFRRPPIGLTREASPDDPG